MLDREMEVKQQEVVNADRLERLENFKSQHMKGKIASMDKQSESLRIRLSKRFIDQCTPAATQTRITRVRCSTTPMG